MKQIKNNMRTFEVKYISATNTQGSRIKITDLLKNESKTIPYNYSCNNVMDGAIEFLENEKNITIEFTSESKGGYLLHTSNFSINLK